MAIYKVAVNKRYLLWFKMQGASYYARSWGGYRFVQLLLGLVCWAIHLAGCVEFRKIQINQRLLAHPFVGVGLARFALFQDK